MFKVDISSSPKCRVRSLLDPVVDNGLVHLSEVSLTPRWQGRSELMDMLFPSAPVLPEHSNLSSQIWFSNRLFKFEDNKYLRPRDWFLQRPKVMKCLKNPQFFTDIERSNPGSFQPEYTFLLVYFL